MKWGAYYRPSDGIKYHKGRRKIIGSYTKEQWQTLCSFFDNICPRCKKKVEKFTADHIVPATLGGTTYIWNIQPLCQKCNGEKSNVYKTDYRPEEVKRWAEDQRNSI